MLALLRIAHSLEYAAWALGEINRKLDAKPRKRGDTIWNSAGVNWVVPTRRDMEADQA